MKRLHRSILHIARFVLEAKTALSIGSGGADGVYDHPIVRDANGLPTLPGTSLAGVLRHLWVQEHGHDLTTANALFGYQHGSLGEASRLEVAASALHDSQNQPVEGLLLGTANRDRLRKDRLLSAALRTRDDPQFRDRVRLNHRGVAVKTGKFDRGLLTAGYRFSGELRLWSEQRDDRDWSALLSLLNDPRLRLGGATRAGLGALRLVELYTGCFDLRNVQDIAAFQALKPEMGERTGLTALPLDSLVANGTAAQILTIELTPRDFWRIGQGDKSLGHGDKTPDLLPKLEPIVVWRQNCAEICTRYALVPGSSVKGALAHRTAFHWNALTGFFVDQLTLDEIAQWDKSAHCPGVMALFGSVKDNTDAARGQVGHLLIDDAQIEITMADQRQHVQAMIHNSIDRFMGGVRDRMLFTEELIYQRPITLRMTLLPGVDAAEPTARRALARAIRDLCEGRLALGAGVTKGHGSFTGTPDANTRNWLKNQGEDWT